MACMEKEEGAYRILAGRPNGKRSHGRPSRRWEKLLWCELPLDISFESVSKNLLLALCSKDLFANYILKYCSLYCCIIVTLLQCCAVQL